MSGISPTDEMIRAAARECMTAWLGVDDYGPVSTERHFEQAIRRGISLVQPKKRIGGLMPRMRDCLTFLNSYTEAHGYPPSFDEIRIALGLKSKSGVHRIITELEDRGAISRIADRGRSIEVLAVPFEAAA